MARVAADFLAYPWPEDFTLPRRLHAGGALPVAQEAMFRLNRWRPGLCRLVSEPWEADCAIVVDAFPDRARPTWVEMDRRPTIVHWGEGSVARSVRPLDVMTHELCHGLWFACDYVYAALMTAPGYHNPRLVDIDDPDRYRGILSALSPPAEWFGADDEAMRDALFPLERRFGAEIARDG